MPAEPLHINGDAIDVRRLLVGLRELSDAFVRGGQGAYGMRVPAERYRDGDLVCGTAYRVILAFERRVADLLDDNARLNRERCEQKYSGETPSDAASIARQWMLRADKLLDEAGFKPDCSIRHALACGLPSAPTTPVLPDDFLGSVRALCVAGRTAGGVAGCDEGLCRVLDRVEAMLQAIDDPDWQRGARGLQPTTVEPT